MLITFSSEDFQTMQELDIDSSMAIPELKGLLSAIMGIPANKQVFVCNGQELPMTGTVESIGLKPKDMVIVVSSNKNIVAPPREQAMSQSLSNQTGPTFFEGMGIEDVMHYNKNPAHIVQVVQGHEYLLRQANFHDTKLGDIFKKSPQQATKELRKFMMMNSAMMATRRLQAASKEAEMRERLAANANDEEASAYFKEKERRSLIEKQYLTVMNDYPESMTRVLMLYINVEINRIPLQAFVDSGAQTSVMSLRCAKKLGLDHLIDERFSSTMVGVGSAKSLGRIHLALLVIEGNFFPVTLTVLDDEKGLGDKNMDFLLGLDMLKRHGCTIDLVKGVLSFRGVKGNQVETPFLHEKDLVEAKGGTKDFDPNNPNKNHPKPEKNQG